VRTYLPPVGRAQHHTDTTSSVLGASASIVGPELPSYRTPALRFALRTMGERGVGAPPSPSLLVSKHTPSVKKSSIWSRKKYPKWGMCSGPPWYYNLINRQAGRPLRLPLPRAARLFSCSPPPRCPKPSPLCGCVRVHQHMIPDDLSIPRRRPWPIGVGRCRPCELRQGEVGPS
jgi:hypothetical protein